MSTRSNCIICNSALTGKQTRFCSLACKNKHHQSYEAQKRRGLSRKLALVKEHGGRCVQCGYNKNLAALTFHHAELGEKDFKLDMRSLSNRRWKAIHTEADRCILVCQNCHAELHSPHLDLANLVP